MGRSVAIIGAGQIGYAASQAFLRKGWGVQILARTKPQWNLGDVDFKSYIAGAETVPTADVVVDTIAFDATDVAHYDPDKIGRLIAVSSASVYCDDQGRTLDEAAVRGFPEFDSPITEEQSTVAPGPETYSTRKIRMEHKAHDLFGERATILRPCAVYGPWNRHPREWWFVKRLIDQRQRIPLAFEGKSTFHTTSARSVGSLAAFYADQGLGGTFNIADDLAPDVETIGHSIAEIFGKRVQFYLMEGPPNGTVGRTPWSVPNPFEVSCAKAYQAGYGDFDVYVASHDPIDWLSTLNPQDWRAAFSQLAAYPWDLFDYEAEDRFLASL